MARKYNIRANDGKYVTVISQGTRHNRIMLYVIQACEELEQDLEEVWCSDLKCVYRLPGETEDEAHWFLYGSAADYGAVRDAVHISIKQREFEHDPLILWSSGD